MFVHILTTARSLPSFHRLIRNSFLLLALFLLPSMLAAQNNKDIQILELGNPIERELTGGQSHSYRIVLTAGQYLHAVADQRGIDVMVTLLNPDGKQITEVDSPNGISGPEPVSAIAETSGSYRLEVRSLEKDAPAGRYEVKIRELRAATEKDKNRITAERVLTQAHLLLIKGTAESLQGTIKKYEEALALYRTAGDSIGEAGALLYLGFVYDSLGEARKALDYYGQALPLLRVAGDRREAATLNNIGTVYNGLGDKQKALACFSQVLPLLRAASDRGGEAATLNNIGTVYSELGNKPKALEYFAQALLLARAAKDRSREAATLHNLGQFYDSLGEKIRALEYYGQTLPLLRAVGDRNGEARTLNNIGLVYDSLGEKQKALDYYNQSLPLSRAIGDRSGEASTLHNIGLVYDSLGEKQKALDYYNQSLPLSRAIGDIGGEAATLNNTGTVYNDLGEKQKALEYYGRALPLLRAVGDRSGEARTLNNIGLIHSLLGDKQKALDYYLQSLPLLRAIGDRSGEAVTLNNVGTVYGTSGDKRKALDYFAQALPLRRAVRDYEGEAGTLDDLMTTHHSLNNLRFAIFYGKQSVNAYQRLRSNVGNLDKNVQKTYLRSVEQTYRKLAELLINQGRSAEAQQVLNAFKDQQFFDFDRAQAKQLKPLTLTPHEDELVTHYENAINNLGAISSKFTELRQKLDSSQPDGEDSRQLQQLEEEFKTASDEFSDFLRQAEAKLSQPAGEKDKVSKVSDTVEMQAALQQLSQETGQKTVAVYTLIGKEVFHALIISADSITPVSTVIKGDELNNKGRQLWGLLRSADYDPTVLSSELYNAIFKPVEDKLPKDTKTIIWSLDGNLRYLPMAALYDGNQYLVERYSHVVFNRADKERLTRGVNPTWNGYGFATSAPHKIEVDGKTVEFRPLDFVRDEMQIFRTKSYLAGIIDGEVFTEAQFTKSSLLKILKQRRPVVHISSHFRFHPGDESLSFLLLGDGTIMTLAEMKEQTNLFQGVELLTLSACDTAAQRPDATGREIDAFAELAQRLGASGVMASLWAVRDRSTAQLMKGFYRNREGGKLTKAEALHKAQLDLLYGRSGVTPLPSVVKNPPTSTTQGNETIRRGGSTDEDTIVEAKYRIPFKTDKSKPFAHPYYWSPFVLFGNWK
ncbi:MAG: tetratricopeptide repeat protein [Pyrinomonadaceae bacterium]